MALAILNKACYTEIQFLNPQQLNCLKSLEKHDTSLIFEILLYYSQYVLVKTCIVVIVVPLKSILQQEIQKLKARVLHLKTGIDFEQPSHISYCIGNPKDVLYHAEKLGTIQKQNMTSLILPEFKRLSYIKHSIQNCLRVLAITAIACHTAQRDILRSLGMKKCTILSTKPVLNENTYINIRSHIPSTGGKPDQIACVVQFHSQQPENVIFYLITIGTGCYLRHVKRVVHVGPPYTLNDYTQKIDHAGRNGYRAQAILYFNATSLAQRYVDKAIKDILKSNKCIRLFFSGYFNVNFLPATIKECCDICANYEQFERPTFIPSLEQTNQ
ncbi:hypothetical protein ACJMK2_009479 [Sinanodonta woodiana]|uniref:DNA 3'-5' helicase n=1 Tax=Sinanodonta woodiana TaxID=1069815 RepID=A0ABD3VFC6_SINWO